MPDPSQPVDYRPGPNGEQIPIYNNATPGIGGAIMDAVKALAMAFAPKSITQAPARMKQQEATASGDSASGAPQTSDLGNQF